MSIHSENSDVMTNKFTTLGALPSQQDIESLITLFGQRRYEDAEQQARALTARFPTDGFGWKALGAVLKQQRRLADAIVPLTRAAELMAEDAEAHFNLASALFEQGHVVEAEAGFRRAIVYNEHYLPAYFNLGNVLQAQRRFAEAEHCYRIVLRHQGGFAEALSNLGAVLKAQGRDNEAEECIRKALVIDPRNIQSLVNLAYIDHAAGRLEMAEKNLRLALSIDADLAEAQNALGVVLRCQERLEEAIACYRRALTLVSEYPEALNNLGNVLRQLRQYDEARTAYRDALALQPNYAEAHYNLGNTFKDQAFFAEAEACYRRAVELKPDYAEAHNNLGNALKGQSRIEEAAISYEAAIALRSGFIESHYALSILKKYNKEDPHRAMLEELASATPNMSVEAQVRYWFTLGKVCEDTCDYDASFAAYRKGNELQRSLLHWDEKAEDDLYDRMMDVFTPEFFAARPTSQHEGRMPIFIVGMPRSGTSLLEQILASYPGVYGAGEMPDLSEVIVESMPDKDYAHFPGAVADFSPDDFLRLGKQYTERLWRHAPDAMRITDKMPANFFYVGLIHLMLPQAKIIHATRDPMDSCFSCYSRLFNESNLSFAYDLGALGRYYARYIKLMRHWHAVLPEGAILDLSYESMVDNTEVQARRLLAYLDLPWDERCLAFHENTRRVKTASVAQVRKLIYKTSLARWQRFGAHLDELHELVKDFRTV